MLFLLCIAATWWTCYAVSYTRGLGELSSDVDQLVLQSVLFQPQFVQSQRLGVEQLQLLMSDHKCFFKAVLETASMASKKERT